MTDSTSGTRRRVKLYALNSERQWDDRGTGHVTSAYVEKLQGLSLLVRAEADGSLLLESKVLRETVYQKQQETLIVWSEGDNFDLALSFQEKAGCDEIWEKICQVHGCDPSVDMTQDIVEESEDERFDDLSDTFHIELPPAEMARLADILQVFTSCADNTAKRERLSLAIEMDNYIPKLMQVFRMCEDLEDMNGLYKLHEIVKNIFYLNKIPLLEAMFKEDTLFDVVGCLEYDRNCPTPKQHRHYLQRMANFKEVLPIHNDELLAKIHQTYRTQYLQDVVLPTPSMFDDNVLSSLSSFIFFNKLDIVKQLQADEKFLSEFFSLLCAEKTPMCKRRDLVLFLKELCSLSHTLQPQNKEAFFKTLLSLGVLSSLETTLTVVCGGGGGGEVRCVKTACVDILMHVVETVPALVREHMLRQLADNCDDDQLLMNLIVEQMVYDRSECDSDAGSVVQLSAIVRTLVDPDNMMAALNRSEKTEFLSFFYKHCVHNLVAPLLSNTSESVPLYDDRATVQLMNTILDLLSFCVEHHTFHAKNFVITRNLVSRALVLMRSRHKYLVLDALRFLRKMVAMKDDIYNRHIVKQNLFAPVVDAFCDNHGRYNLLDSAVIELFEFIKSENIKLLLLYSVETFGDRLLATSYVSTFRCLKQRYEQHQERVRDRCSDAGEDSLSVSDAPLDVVSSVLRPVVGAGAGTARFRRDPRQMDEDEEMWFNDESEFDGSPPPPAPHTTSHTTSHTLAEDRLDHCLPNNNNNSNSSSNNETDSGHGDVSPTTTTDMLSTDLHDPAPGSTESTDSVSTSCVDTKSSSTSSVSSSSLVIGGRMSPAHAAVTTTLLTTHKVGLVDYDADSDEEEEEEESEEKREGESDSEVAESRVNITSSPPPRHIVSSENGARASSPPASPHHEPSSTPARACDDETGGDDGGDDTVPSAKRARLA